MSVKTHTTYTFKHEDQAFPLPFSPSGEITIWMRDDGLCAVLGALDRDEDPADPFEAFDEGEFYQFDRRHFHDRDRPNLEEWKYGAELVGFINCYMPDLEEIMQEAQP